MGSHKTLHKCISLLVPHFSLISSASNIFHLGLSSYFMTRLPSIETRIPLLVRWYLNRFNFSIMKNQLFCRKVSSSLEKFNIFILKNFIQRTSSSRRYLNIVIPTFFTLPKVFQIYLKSINHTMKI